MPPSPIKVGAVYRNRDGIEFLTSVDRISGDASTVQLRLVNIANWISLGGITGKQLPNGNVLCDGFDGELVAPSFIDYWRRQEFVFLLTVAPGGKYGIDFWQVAFVLRPPTTVEALAHLEEQAGTLTDERALAFLRACVALLKERGVPENYTAGSQGVACSCAERIDRPKGGKATIRPHVELRLARSVPLVIK